MRDFVETVKTKIVEDEILTKNQNLFLNVNNLSDYEIL